MKTIEERANELFPYTYEEGYGDFNVYARNWFIKVSTDQRKIDIERAKEAFNKAVGWCRTYQWYQAVCDEFVKALEDGE